MRFLILILSCFLISCNGKNINPNESPKLLTLSVNSLIKRDNIILSENIETINLLGKMENTGRLQRFHIYNWQGEYISENTYNITNYEICPSDKEWFDITGKITDKTLSYLFSLEIQNCEILTLPKAPSKQLHKAIRDYEIEIRSINLDDLSKEWAKKYNIGYELPEDAFEQLQAELHYIDFEHQYEFYLCLEERIPPLENDQATFRYFQVWALYDRPKEHIKNIIITIRGERLE